MTITVTRTPYSADLAQELIAELQLEYGERYGGPDETPVDPNEFEPPHGVFFVAQHAEQVVGCAGLRRHTEREVEVKRMFIRRPFRGRGWSRELLRLIENEARALGFGRMLMETGLAQPEAMRLYESSGYESIPGFGHYRDEPMNRCYAKWL